MTRDKSADWCGKVQMRRYRVEAALVKPAFEHAHTFAQRRNTTPALVRRQNIPIGLVREVPSDEG